MSVDICCEMFRLGDSEIAIELTADNNGLTACRLLEGTCGARIVSSQTHLRSALKELRDYFAGRTRDFHVPLAPDGTPFQKRVWLEAQKIPHGEVRSYAWLAQRTGNPNGARAVANALGANPLLLFVPCHRVIKSDGNMGGFSCGVQYKQLLLQHEAPLSILVDSLASAKA